MAIRDVLKSDFVRSFLTLLSGTLIAQLIPVIATPLVIAHFFTTEDFGIFATYSGVVGIIGAIATARFELAIVPAQTDQKAKQLYYLCIVIALITSAISFLGILFMELFFEDVLERYALVKWAWLMPVSIFFMALFNLNIYWLNRWNAYKTMSAGKIMQTTSTLVVNFYTGFRSWGAVGLISSQIVGHLVTTIFLSIVSFNQLKRVVVDRLNLRFIAKEFIDFPLKSTLGVFLNLLANQLPVVIIPLLFGQVKLGLYALVLRILNVPLTMVGKSISQVFMQKASIKVNKGETLLPLVRQISLSLFAMAIIPLGILYIWAEDLFVFFFGEEWREAGEIARIFVFFYLIRFVFSPLSVITIVKRKLKTEVVFNALLLLSQLCSLYIGYFLGDYLTSFLLMSISGGCLFIGLGVVIFRLSMTVNEEAS